MITDSTKLYDTKRRRLYVCMIGFVTLVILSVFISFSAIERYFLLETAQSQSATLRLAVDSLRLTLDRYSRIPALIAGRPEISAFLDEPENNDLKTKAEALLSETAEALGAKGVYLEDEQGELLVSAQTSDNQALVQSQDQNQNQPSSFYRPYFDQVFAGGIGQYYALGTENGERGYFYAAPVRRQKRMNGVVAVRFAVNQFEASLRDADAEIIVRDSNDIVFISSRDDWNFKSFTKLSDNKRKIIESAKQYPLEFIDHLPNKVEPVHGNVSIIEMEGSSNSYIAATSLLARAGWRITILSPTRDALLLAIFVAAGTILLALFTATVVLLILQRQIRYSERLSEQKASKIALERRVQTRTEELNQSNTQLIAEIDERKATEKQLRQTQNELIQAGKLAALGQMSAAISHEFNQPLAATKAYAENAATLIDRERVVDARKNLTQIASMVDRMSSIAKHLRNFARRPQEKTKPVSVLSVIDAVMELMRSQIELQGIKVLFERPEQDIWVIGGEVRLQQVLLNLIRNALNAMENTDEPELTLSVNMSETNVRIAVKDNGPGVEQALSKKIFDPFFSTKSPGADMGHGMGLGLSISYNIIKDFGGELVVKNAIESNSAEDASNSTTSKSGAIFEMVLMPTQKPQMVDAAQ